MARFLYQIDPYAKEVQTEIKAAFVEDGRSLVSLDACIFHPQGGGQKGDRGTVVVGGDRFDVLDTIKDPYSDEGRPVMIVAGEIARVSPGDSAVAELDWAFREMQMRLHGAVHAHHCTMEDILGASIPHPRTSDIQDGGTAFNRYETSLVDQKLVEDAARLLAETIHTGSPVSMEDDAERPGFRWWRCDGHAIPCGGTHFRNLKEIGPLLISYSQKKGQRKVTIAAK